jgi:hypothetical protein
MIASVSYPGRITWLFRQTRHVGFGSLTVQHFCADTKKRYGFTPGI